MPFGLAGLMLTVKDLRGRAGFVQGFCFGMGFMLPLMRWITIIGPDAWVALAVLEALFYGADGGRLGLAAVASAGGRSRSPWYGSVPSRCGASSPSEGCRGERLAFGLVDTPVVRWGRVGGTAAGLVRRGAGRGGHRRRGRASRPPRPGHSAASRPSLALTVGSLALPIGIAGADGTTQVAAVQGNVPGEGMDPFAERRAVLDNHSQATIDFAAAGRRPASDPSPTW